MATFLLEIPTFLRVSLSLAKQDIQLKFSPFNLLWANFWQGKIETKYCNDCKQGIDTFIMAISIRYKVCVVSVRYNSSHTNYIHDILLHIVFKYKRYTTNLYNVQQGYKTM